MIGYLDIIQRLLTEFFTSLNDQIEKTIEFCEEIVLAVAKKQLTFKAVEILYLIKEKSDNEVIKHKVKKFFVM